MENIKIIKNIIRIFILVISLTTVASKGLFGATVYFPQLYITNTNSNDISVYNTADMTQISGSSFTAGKSPIAAVVNPFTNRLYIANYGDNTLSIYDTISMTQIIGSPFAVGNGPMAMALDIQNNLLYVVNFIDNNLRVYDTITMLEIPGSPFPTGRGPIAIVLDSVFKRLYIANNVSNSVTVYDTSSMTQLLESPLAVGSRPAGLAVDPVSRRLYVANSGSNDVMVYDTTTMMQILGSPFMTGMAPTAVSIDPVNRRLYVANAGSNNITVYNTDNMIPMQGSPFAAGFGPRGMGMAAQHVVYVDRVNGDDVNGNGSVLNPYKTITKGLAESIYGQIVQVAPGIYNATNGELFPIQLKEGIVLLGTDAQRTIIRGWGDFNSPSKGGVRVGILCSDSAMVTGFTIINPQSFNNYYSLMEGGIWCEGTSPEISRNIFKENGVAIVSVGSSSSTNIKDNTIINNGTGIGIADSSTAYVYGNKISNNYEGIRVAHNSTPLISGNTLTNNSYDAIGVWLSNPEISGNIISRNRVGIFSGSGSYSIVTGNRITMNSLYGILITQGTARPDLGGGDGSAGNNVFKNNGSADVCNETTNTIYALSNIWDHNPPTIGTSCTEGVDIGNTNSGNVIFD